MHKSREFPIEASSQDAAISLAKEQMRPGEQVHNIYQKVSPARNRKGIYVLVVNVEPMVHSALIVAIVTHRASIQMLSSELVVFKIGAFGSAQLWFKAPLAAIEQLSLSSPHMIVRSPEGKKLSVTFNSRHDAEIARANLFLLVQEPDASKGEPVAGDLSSQTNAPTSPPTVPVLSAAVASELQRSPESLRAAKSNLHFTQMIGGAVAFVIGVAVTALTYSGLGDEPPPAVYQNNSISIYLDADGSFTSARYDPDAAQIVIDHANRMQAFRSGQLITVANLTSAAATTQATFRIEISLEPTTLSAAAFASTIGFDIGFEGGNGAAQTSELLWFENCSPPACGCMGSMSAPYCDARQFGTVQLAP